MARNLIKRRAVDAAFAILVAGGLAYFGVRALQGDSGLFARLAIETEAARLETELAALTDRRRTLETLTKRLSDGYLDLELLDERARDVLGLVRADEVVIR